MHHHLNVRQFGFVREQPRLGQIFETPETLFFEHYEYFNKVFETLDLFSNPLRTFQMVR